MEHQLAAAQLVVADQRPGIEAQSGIRQLQVVDGLFRQLLHPPAEVIGQVADQSADEWQLDSRGKAGFAEAGQGLAQALGEVRGRFARHRRQFCQGPGAEQVVASTLGHRATGVQQHGARCLAHQGEAFAGRFMIGKGV
ncbi:hypothetical protein FQZ97_808510 [compost metagenome]